MARAIAALLVILLLVFGMAMLIEGCSRSSRNQPPPKVTVESIVAQLRPIQQLTTLHVGVSGIVNASQPGAYFWQSANRLVLLVRGEGLYATDLDDVLVTHSDQCVVLTLSRPQLVNAWVDVNQSRVWERQNGWFNESGINTLEESAWHEAFRLVNKAASCSSYQERAMEQAEDRIRHLLTTVIPNCTVTIEWRT